MAFCVFDIDEESHCKIVDWNVLNLCESQTLPNLCNQLLKSKRVCNKKAKYTKNAECVCETHAKSSNHWLLPLKSYSISHLKKQPLHDLKQLRTQLIPSTSTTTTTAKKNDMVEEIFKYYEERVWKTIPIEKKNANMTNLISIGRELNIQLKKNEFMSLGVTHVIIENQISPIANRMKTIQGMLAQHFISLDVPCISFVSSANKLKAFEEVSEGKTNYQKHKKDAVFHCAQTLEKMGEEKWMSFFASYGSKKDDLSDCFLQGVWFMEKEKEKEKLSK